jgi:hypothetical protein
MASRKWNFAAVGAAALALAFAGCKTTQSSAPESAGTTPAGTPSGNTSGGTSGSGGTSVPALVSVDLHNVLNNLSVSLNVNRDNIPVTAQVPIDVAASVCGVSVSALAASAANGHASCTATTSSPQLTQAVQQQIASGGSVTGGSQTMGSPTNNMM